MPVVETISKIRRMCPVGGRSVRSVARDLGLARNTVRRVVRGEATGHRHDRGAAQPYPRLDGFIGGPEGFPRANRDRVKRDRETLRSIWRKLCDQGCGAGYDAVRRYARQWEERQGGGLPEACVPLASGPGEAFRFDWSHGRVRLAGMPQVVKVARFTLRHSRMPFVHRYPRGTQEMVFDAHDRAFAAFGGQTVRGIHDSMTTAVSRVLAGRGRTINARFGRMCPHHLIRPEFRPPRAGWEKGRVERQTGTLRRTLFLPPPGAGTLECLNGQLAERVLRHARTQPHPEFPEMSVHGVFPRGERRCLAPATPPFRGHAPFVTTASGTCMVRFGMNRYPVDARAAGPSRAGPTRTASRSASTAGSSRTTSGTSAATDTSTTSGTSSRSWNAGRARCATGRRFGPGTCLRRWRR